MEIQTVQVRSREVLLRSWMGAGSSSVLNSVPPTPPLDFPGVELAAKIKNAINAVKIVAMDPGGHAVDYHGLAISDEYLSLRNWVALLPGLDLESLRTGPEQLAFWINLYNTLIIDAVIQFNVEGSVTGGFLGVLTFFEKAAYQIGGQRFSLTDIEHGILRTNRGFPYFLGPHFSPDDVRRNWILSALDPRIHFALNCASRSCPPIGAYSPDPIDDQLDLASRNFLDQNIAINSHKGIISLSSIFRWYRADFGGRSGILAFLQRHLPDDNRKSWIKANALSLRFKFQPYDWGLNTSGPIPGM